MTTRVVTTAMSGATEISPRPCRLMVAGFSAAAAAGVRPMAPTDNARSRTERTRARTGARRGMRESRMDCDMRPLKGVETGNFQKLQTDWGGVMA